MCRDLVWSGPGVTGPSVCPTSRIQQERYESSMPPSGFRRNHHSHDMPPHEQSWSPDNLNPPPKRTPFGQVSESQAQDPLDYTILPLSIILCITCLTEETRACNSKTTRFLSTSSFHFAYSKDYSFIQKT